MTLLERLHNHIHSLRDVHGILPAKRKAVYNLTQDLLDEIDETNTDPNIEKIVFILRMMNDKE
jgi:hypothetical protein